MWWLLTTAGTVSRIARLTAIAWPAWLPTHTRFEALGLSDITVVGHSMGCGVALAYWDL